MHRWIAAVALCACTTTQGPDGLAPRKAEPEPGPRPQPVHLVATARVEVAAADVDGLVHAVRARVEGAQGHVATEEVTGTDPEPPRATLQIRLPRVELVPFVDWLAARSQVLARHLAAQDVARDYLDEELALGNLRTTMQRLEDLAAQGARMSEVLALEQELTRVRGEIERLEGAHRVRGDQVALATLDLEISRTDVALARRAKFQLVPSATVLALGGSARAGGGMTLMFARCGSLELQLFPARGAQARALLVTVHTAAYSDFFGGGRRRFLNPYLGLLVGGGSLDRHGVFTAGAELGLELYRGQRLLVQLDTRAQYLRYGDRGPPSDLGVQLGLGMGVPF